MKASPSLSEHKTCSSRELIKSTSRHLYGSITAAILRLGVRFTEQMGVNVKLSVGASDAVQPRLVFD